MVETNEIKKSSFESKLYEVIDQLKEERNKRFEANKQTNEDISLKEECDLPFTNKALMEQTKEVMDCKDTDKKGLFWSEMKLAAQYHRQRLQTYLNQSSRQYLF